MKRGIIFISYYFYPNKEVGANRIRFWVSYLLKFYPDIEPIVVTATRFSDDEKIADHQYYVEPDDNRPLGWFIKDQGVNWKAPLVNFFSKTSFDNIEGIVMTGGPFMHFSAIPQLKALCNCKFLIDFRDPFSDNHRFSNSWIKKCIKRYYERKFVESADLVVSVNEDFFNTMAGYSPDIKKFHVIPNGYDDISMEQARTSSKQNSTDSFKLIVAGKYYTKADPFETINAILELNHEGVNIIYSHYGGSETGIKEIPVNDNIREFGVTDYVKIAEALVTSDVGLLITQGVQQNTPTKLFDYIGAELPILIITDGEFHSGNAHSITKGYPLVKWCRNNKSDIKQALIELVSGNLTINYPERIKYSRRKGLESLLKKMEILK